MQYLKRYFGMDKRIRLLVAILSLFVGAAILFFPVFIKWKGIFHNDQAMSEWIRHYFFAWNLQKGIFPLWDPHVWCGAMPHYAFIFAGENYYFLTWPFLYLANLNSLDNAYRMICLAPLFMHYLIAIAGMFLLLKKAIRCNWIASFAGAFVYMYSPAFSYAYVSQDNLIMQAWLPWLLYVYARTLEKFAFWKLCVGAIIFSFIWFGGKLQYMPFMLYIWAGFIIVWTVQNRDERNKFNFTRPAGIAAFMFILGTALSAVYLLPVIESLRFTKLHLDLNLLNAISHKPGNMPIAYLVTLFLPGFFGNIAGQHFISERLMFWDANMSGGMMTTFVVSLAALAPIAIFPRTRRISAHRTFIILGISLYIFSVFCSLGGNTPLYRVLVGWIPLVNVLPYPIRYRMVQCFAASLLIGVGIHFMTSYEYPAMKRRMLKFAWIYIGFSLMVIMSVLLWPCHKTIPAAWRTPPGGSVKNFLTLRQPVGLYTPKTARVRKLRVSFDGPSEGQLRYADASNVAPNQGKLVKNYAVFEKGWAEFNVDIPPDKFLWIVPVAGEGRIGYWKDEDHCFLYDTGWRIDQRTSAINMYAQSYGGRTSLLFRLLNGYVAKGAVVYSLLYWAVLAVCILMGIRLLSLKQFGYLAAFLVIVEFFCFGVKAFYGCTFNEAGTEARSFLPHNVRARVPSEHAMIQQMLQGVFPVIGRDMRIATEYPFYDNFVYLYQGFALMGEPPFPLEKRFKEAIEMAYGRPMDQSMFYEGGGGLPVSAEFLNNFSVKYFLTGSVQRVFPDEQYVAINGSPGKYIHINKEALPRAYTVDNIILASDDRALKELVSGDLGGAFYINSEEGLCLADDGKQDHSFDFQSLQNKNRIEGLDFSNPNEIKLNADIKVPSMLVLTEVWFPGWEAFDGNNRARIYRVNYCQRGIWLEKGQHQVRLRFRPLAWRIGLGISLGAALSMGVFLIMKAMLHNA